MNLNTIFNRVAKWNELRYPRVYNYELTLALINEEHQELLDAKTQVDKLDALCDMIYVACGGLWKLKVGKLDAASLFRLSNGVNAFNLSDSNDIIKLKFIILSAIKEAMKTLNLTEAEVFAALLIVCDSNDSKSAAMTNPGIKANINKGAEFIKPEPRLQLLLDSRGKL